MSAQAQYAVHHRWDGSFSVQYTRGDRAGEQHHYRRQRWPGGVVHVLAFVTTPVPLVSFLDTLESPFGWRGDARP